MNDHLHEWWPVYLLAAATIFGVVVLLCRISRLQQGLDSSEATAVPSMTSWLEHLRRPISWLVAIAITVGVIILVLRFVQTVDWGSFWNNLLWGPQSSSTTSASNISTRTVLAPPISVKMPTAAEWRDASRVEIAGVRRYRMHHDSNIWCRLPSGRVVFLPAEGYHDLGREAGFFRFLSANDSAVSIEITLWRR